MDVAGECENDPLPAPKGTGLGGPLRRFRADDTEPLEVARGLRRRLAASEDGGQDDGDDRCSWDQEAQETHAPRLPGGAGPLIWHHLGGLK